MIQIRHLSQFMRTSQPWSSRLALPEKLKGGRIEKLMEYWKSVARDYRDAMLEIRNGAKEKPAKTLALTSTLAVALYLNKHNPDEQSFKDHFVRFNADVMNVSSAIRNPEAEDRQNLVAKCQNQLLLRRLNLGICSILWMDNDSSESAAYASQCSYLKPGILDFGDRIVDIGFLDRWWILDQKLKDYDVNPNEWDDQGRPRQPSSQLKHMW